MARKSTPNSSMLSLFFQANFIESKRNKISLEKPFYKISSRQILK